MTDVTKPTPAQIEAVEEAIIKVLDIYRVFGWQQNEINHLAKVAITAAAEVGEPEDWIKKRADIRATAIERCAQVAENFYKQGPEIGTTIGNAIAAAIRDLKDK